MTLPYLKLTELRTSTVRELETTPIRIGRDPDCELLTEGDGSAVVSGFHCRLELTGERWVLADTGSRNGTFLDDRRLSEGERVALRAGQVIRLGESGPRFRIEEVARRVTPATMLDGGAASRLPPPPPPPPREKAPTPRPKSPAAPPPPAAASPAPGGASSGRTMMFRGMVEEARRESAQRVQAVAIGAFAAMVLLAAGAWWYTQRVSDHTNQLLAEQAQELAQQKRMADSVRQAANAEYERLKAQLASAQSSGASTAVVDSLARALGSAERRTASLEGSLRKAETALQQQLAAGEQLKRQAETEMARLRAEVEKGRSSQISPATLDSLARKLREAEQHAARIDEQVRAARTTDLAAVAQLNQAAVGLVTAWFGKKAFDGSGFVLTRGGAFVTNRHVVRDGEAEPDSLTVILADTRQVLPAQVVALGGKDGPDLAVLLIAGGVKGPAVHRVDWAGATVKQGEAMAVIGFPAGANAAFEQSQVARTSMSAGIFSKIGPDQVQFDALTVAGSSGSPVFNSAGEVVAVHRAKLPEGNVAVPVQRLLPLLPADVRKDLGL